MKHISKFLTLSMLMIMAACSFTSCSDDDDSPSYNSTEAIAGTYIGKLNMVGYPDSEAEVGYVTLTRKSSSSVSCTIESEGWNVNMESVNLAVTFSGNIVNLTSETAKTISGQIINGNIQLTYETTAGNVFQFLGKKD